MLFRSREKMGIFKNFSPNLPPNSIRSIQLCVCGPKNTDIELFIFGNVVLFSDIIYTIKQSGEWECFDFELPDYNTFDEISFLSFTAIPLPSNECIYFDNIKINPKSLLPTTTNTPQSSDDEIKEILTYWTNILNNRCIL